MSHGDPATDPLLLAWLGAVDYAAERGLPLFSDDLALRGLARQYGVAAFGTVGLLDVLVEDGRLVASVLDDILLRLRRAWFVDLPDRPGHLEALAEEGGFAAGPAVLTFARAVLWQPIERGSARSSMVSRAPGLRNIGTDSWSCARRWADDSLPAGQRHGDYCRGMT